MAILSQLSSRAGALERHRTRVTWEIEKVAAGFSRLTVIHELEGAPIMAAMVASKLSEQGTGWLGLDSQRHEVAA